MKQFNLEEYLENPDRRIITRDGRNVRIVCTDRKSATFPIVVLIEGCYQENICAYTKDGLYSHGMECPCDLCFAPIKKEGWINVCRGCGEYNTYVCNRIFATKEEAKREKRDIIATIKIEWEE